MEGLNNEILRGLCTNLLEAEVNNKIYLRLKKVWDKLCELDEEDQYVFSYIKKCAVNNTVLNLAKLYDTPSKKYPTRCIISAIDLIESADLKIKKPAVKAFLWDKFQRKYSNTLKMIFGVDEPQPDVLLERIKLFIEQQSKLSGTSLEKLKTWRDKFLAHNESVEDYPNLKDSEVQDLIAIPHLMVEYINQFISNEMIVVTKPGQDYFIMGLLKKYGI